MISNAVRIATLTPGLLRPSIALATSRAGELPVLDFETVTDAEAIRKAIVTFDQVARAPFGVKLDANNLERTSVILSHIPVYLTTVILNTEFPLSLFETVTSLRVKNITALLEITNVQQGRDAEKAEFDAVIVKGHEAGGRVSGETSFILLQRVRAEIALPVWVRGGIGIHTAAAAVAGGAAGLILDVQLALTRESSYPDHVRARIAAMDGSETICVGDVLGSSHRVYHRPGILAVKELQDIEARLSGDARPMSAVREDWRRDIAARGGWDSEDAAWPIGQDAAFARSLAERFETVAGILHAIRGAVSGHAEAAMRLRPLAEGSPLARANNTRYPILQGPMTRVSDVPEFAARVAEGGGLPFLALALMRGPDVETVLAEAQRRLGEQPWGVGILGFVPLELRQEQMEVIRNYKPPFALIAGGRPDQARTLEQDGITTYLHVPSPGLLRMFVQQGARRFVFEGRECGGHVGPRTSFVLWNQMIEALLEAPELAADAEQFHIVFAAGIHDALSASMVAVMAAPLAARGVRIGVLIGTAYLFTEEAVASGAILETFQEQARQCENTVLLETAPGHSTRCVDTAFAETFLREKRTMTAQGRSPEEIRLGLEELNLGRLRVASKGVTRDPKFGQDPSASKLAAVAKDEQLQQGMYMIGQVAALRDQVCSIRELHHDITVNGTNRLETLGAIAAKPAAVHTEHAPSDVAIIGLACLLPKAPDVRTYWENIIRKVDAVGEVPKDRWDPELYFDSDPKAKDKVYSRWGGFLEDVPFDPVQYGMPPASLRSIEPAQLLTLEVVRAALEDAGYSKRPFPRERTSVILGAGGGAADLGLGYSARSFLPALEYIPELRGRSGEIIEHLNGRLPEWTEDSFAGILTNVAAGRVANRFDLGGSNYTIDAACASSLAAVSQALKELETKTSDMVIVGGMDTMQNPFTYLCFSKTHALSPRGRCRTFDETADGIAISEGIAIMVFKRLADAERDGDRIYAVIKSAGSSSDGKDRGLTAPRPEGQARALNRAYAKAGFSPATVGLIEAHGTGTVAGDGAEVQALTKVFSQAEAAKQGCAIGSVKSMIGHTKCTAGAAGLMKAALALHHKVLPPTLGVEKPNSRAKFEESPFFVNTEARPWLENSQGIPRRAGVSAFGFGGTNFHVVLEEYRANPFASDPAPYRQWPEELFLWKADSRQTLLSTLDVWDKALAVDATPELRDLAYTAWRQFAANASGPQLAIVANGLDDLKQKLATARQQLARPDTARIQDPRGVYFSEDPAAAQGKVAFLFPGQGSQYPRMLQDLLLHFPELRDAVERAAKVLESKTERALSAYLFPPPAFSREEERAHEDSLKQTNIAQPALGAASWAMFQLLQEFGLRPDMAAGHSYGEYVALASAGVFDTDALIALSEARGRFIVEGAGNEPGTMAAIEADGPTVAEALKSFEGVCLANANAPKQSVISGTRAGVASAVEHFKQRGLTARAIPVACAFHSPVVVPAQERLAEFLAGVAIATPAFPVYSNTTAAPYPTEPEAIAQRLVDHLVRPVEFAREIEAMYADGARVFIEVGPRGVLTGLVDQILADRPKVAVASNQNGRPGLTHLLHLLGQLAAEGHAVKLDRLYRGRCDRQLDLSALPRECAPKPLAPSVWMVNGARAVPLKEASISKVHSPLPEAVPHRTAAAPAAAKAFTNGNHVANGNHEAASASPVPALSLNAEAVAPLPLDGVPQTVERFQQLMLHFLDTQKSIMLAYLGTEQNGNGPALPQVAAVPDTVVSREPEPDPAVPEIVPPVNGKGPDVHGTGFDKASLTTKLISIVSERTGYPPEMLALNADLEADLGIDSIKRVEILGTFQQSFAGEGIQLDPNLMEKLSGVRTLQGILDTVTEQVSGSAEAPVRQAAAPAALPAVAAMSRETLTAQLLAIVSDRTGYPAEMLGLNQDLEADLGIDSIKRVEILGTFQQSFAEAGIRPDDGLMEKLSAIRTLQAIIDQVIEHLGHAQPSAQHAPLEAPAEHRASEDRIRRYVLKTVETPLHARNSLDQSSCILIVEGAHAVSAALIDRLRLQGCNIAAVRNESAGRELPPGHYVADLSSPDSLRDLIETVQRRQGSLGGIVHLATLGGPPEESRGLGKTLFRLAQASATHLRQTGRQNRAFFLAATGMGGSEAQSPEHGAIAGFVKTLAMEWPEVTARVVDLDLRESGSTLAEYLMCELEATDEHVEIGYAAARRVTLVPTDAPIGVDQPNNVKLDADSVILITGGARGITARVALRLAELYRPKLVLIGRTPLAQEGESAETAGRNSAKEIKAALIAQFKARGETVTPAQVEQAFARLMSQREVARNLEALRGLGAEVHYHSVDVRDPHAFGSVIDGVYQQFGRLDGVVHGAGVIEDKLIQDKSIESFDRVFGTKVDSAFVLADKLRPESLQFLMFFSSVAGRFGNSGQADYAAANEVLSKLAVSLDRSWPARVVSIAWGPWDTEGMVSDAVRKQFAERGVELIPADSGVQRFEEELKFGRRGEAEVVIGGAGWTAPREQAAPISLPLLAEEMPVRTGNVVELYREIRTSRDVYLDDHRLDGQPVLPLAISTELIAEAVARAWPDLQVAAVRDLRLLHGVVLDTESRALRIKLRPDTGPPSKPSSVAVEVSTVGQARLHYRAMVDLEARLGPSPVPSLPSLFNAQAFEMPIADLYRRWMFHGPMFHGIQRVEEVAERGIRAVLAGSSPKKWIAGANGSKWLIDPLMFDSALQLLILWSRHYWDMTALPSGFKRYRRFTSANAESIQCEMRILPATGGQQIHCDLIFIDPATGGVIAILEDMQGACSRALNRLADSETMAAVGGLTA